MRTIILTLILTILPWTVGAQETVDDIPVWIAEVPKNSSYITFDTFPRELSYIEFDIDILRFEDSNGRTWRLVVDSTPICDTVDHLWSVDSTSYEGVKILSLKWDFIDTIGWEYSLGYREIIIDTVIECWTEYGLIVWPSYSDSHCRETLWVTDPSIDITNIKSQFNQRRVCDTIIKGSKVKKSKREWDSANYVEPAPIKK